MACTDILRSVDVGNAAEMSNISSEDKPVKKFRPSYSWLEKKKLQNAIEERRAVLEEERIEKSSQLSQAEWLPVSHLAKVTKQVGRQWSTMGHSCFGDMYLYPEEALFLLEANMLELRFGGVPMSLQQAYSLLLTNGTGCTMEEYKTYAHLSRYGFKVRRHKPELGVNPKREESLEVDVVGVICKRKPSEGVNPEGGGANHSSVHQETKFKASCEDDDDIKFIECVQSDRKRKLSSSFTMDNVDGEVASTVSRGKKSCDVSVDNHSDRSKHGDVKNEVGKLVSNAVNSKSDTESISTKRPSRGLYGNNPLLTISNDAESHTEHSSPANTPSTQGCSKNEENSKPIDRKPHVPDLLNDDVIILSDDESKEDSKKAKELLKFNKEISLIELIDISEEDEGKKVVQSCRTDSRSETEDNAFDFWGVLGRIPTLENGRMVMIIPAPPRQLIPGDIKVSRKEYVLDMMTSVDRPNKEENHGLSRKQREMMPCGSRRGGGNFHRVRASQEFYRQRFLEEEAMNRSTPRTEPPPQHQQQMFPGNVPIPFNPLVLNNFLTTLNNAAHHQFNPGNVHNPFYGSNPNIQNNGFPRPLWNSVVYSQRHPSTPSPLPRPFFPPSSSAQYPLHNVQRMSSFQRLDHFSQHCRFAPMPSPWQRHSNYPRLQQRSVGSWFREGRSGYHPRDNIRPYRTASRNPSSSRNEERYSSAVPKVPDALNWLDLKVKGDVGKRPEVLDEEVKIECPKVDSKEIMPLIKPQDSTSLDVVQSKLQITSSSKGNCSNIPENHSTSMSIKYDLYAPSSNFRKSCPGPPKYRISIVNSEDNVPSMKDVHYLLKDLVDNVPLLFVVCSMDNINFFSFSEVSLPQL